GGDRITDPDAGAVEGIAVTATAGNGTWQFSTDDGASWADLGAVTPTAARLLAADAQTRIRFVPGADFTGTIDPAVTFRAWDRSTGTNGGPADTSANGGSTAFSTATETASLVVTPVNDAPSFAKGPNQIVPVDAGPQTVAAWATALSAGPADESGQSLTFLVSTTNNALFAALPAVSPATGNLTYTPAAGAIGVATVTVRLKDNGGTANGGADTSAAQTFTIVVNPTGNAPFPVADEASTTDQQPVTVDVLANDIDPNGDPLTLVSVSAGALGTATVVNNQVRYVPRANAHGDDVLTYTVRDPAGNTAAGILTVHVTDVTAPTVQQVRVYYGNGRYELLTGRIAVYGWSNVRRIQVVFSEDVSVQQSDLTLTGASVANYGFTGFSYNAATFTATWTRTAAIGIDRLRLALDGTTAGGVKDAAGNLLGADVVRQFAVLPGDLDGDGLVTLAEANTVRRNIGRRYPTPRTADVNGDGLVTRIDYFIARANIGRRI
ncbi:MAG TPA: Ig-like domain-containing protein, partial [Gemmataceae bacterium]|nr:Ig-like domain-containing protein [Gemmataceae bacterium]